MAGRWALRADEKDVKRSKSVNATAQLVSLPNTQYPHTPTHPPRRHSSFFRAAEMAPIVGSSVAHRDPSPRPLRIPRAIPKCPTRPQPVTPREWSIHELAAECWRPSPPFRRLKTRASALAYWPDPAVSSESISPKSRTLKMGSPGLLLL
jgi:hypothetical protein